MAQIYHIVGEDINDDIIEFDFEGTIEDARIECDKILGFAGGGHLDIMIITDSEDIFVEDIEW